MPGLFCGLCGCHVSRPARNSAKWAESSVHLCLTFEPYSPVWASGAATILRRDALDHARAQVDGTIVIPRYRILVRQAEATFYALPALQQETFRSGRFIRSHCPSESVVGDD